MPELWRCSEKPCDCPWKLWGTLATTGDMALGGGGGGGGTGVYNSALHLREKGAVSGHYHKSIHKSANPPILVHMQLSRTCHISD